jgi:hypothetical protein
MKNVFKRMGRFIVGETAREREQSYLEGATSIVDLEQRMREIDHGRFRSKF